MKNLISVIFGLLFISSSIAQINSDSLWEIWNDETQEDSARFKSMKEISWDGYLFTKPDSAIYFADLQLDLAIKKKNKKYIAGALNTKGVANYLLGNFDEAENYYTESLQILLEIDHKKGIANAYNNLAIIYDQTDIPKAIIYYNKGLQIFEELKDNKGIANAHNNLGTILDDQGDYGRAITHYLISLKNHEIIGNKRGIASSCNNIAILYDAQEKPEKALLFNQRSLDLNIEIDNKIGYSTAYNNIGIIYETLSELTKAETYYTKSLEIKKELGDKIGAARTYNNLASLYQTQKKYDKSLLYYEKSLEIKRELNDQKGISISYVGLSRLYNTLNKPKQAILFANDALKIATNLENLPQIKDAYFHLWSSYKLTKNYQKALTAYENYVVTNDSLNSKNNKRKIIEQEYQYTYEKQQIADSLKNEEKNKVHSANLLAEKAISEKRKAELEIQSKQKGYLYIVLGISLLFGLFMLNRINKIQKQKKEIEEKNSIVENQKYNLEKANKETNLQKEELEIVNLNLEEASKEINDSINYAEMIQQAVLPSLKIKELEHEAFVYYNPKDRVSGDFYWLEQNENYSGYCVADCTGHGIPGAFISMVGTILLNEIYNSKRIEIPNQILDELSRLVKITLTNKEGYTMKDGMDISFAALNNKKKVLYFSGANNPIWIVSSDPVKSINMEMVEPKYKFGDKNIFEIKGDKQPVGEYGELAKPFSLHSVKLIEGDSFYLFSDGYVDQFGGEKNKKFKAKAFRELLIEINQQPMAEQKTIIEKRFLDWKKVLNRLTMFV